MQAVDQWHVRDQFYKTYAEPGREEPSARQKDREAFHRALGKAQENEMIKVLRTDAGQTMVWLRDKGEGF